MVLTRNASKQQRRLFNISTNDAERPMKRIKTDIPTTSASSASASACLSLSMALSPYRSVSCDGTMDDTASMQDMQEMKQYKTRSSISPMTSPIVSLDEQQANRRSMISPHGSFFLSTSRTFGLRADNDEEAAAVSDDDCDQHQHQHAHSEVTNTFGASDPPCGVPSAVIAAVVTGRVPSLRPRFRRQSAMARLAPIQCSILTHTIHGVRDFPAVDGPMGMRPQTGGVLMLPGALPAAPALPQLQPGQIMRRGVFKF